MKQCYEFIRNKLLVQNKADWKIQMAAAADIDEDACEELSAKIQSIYTLKESQPSTLPD